MNSLPCPGGLRPGVQSHSCWLISNTGSLGSSLSVRCPKIFQATKHACAPILSFALSPDDLSAALITLWLDTAWEPLPWDPRTGTLLPHPFQNASRSRASSLQGYHWATHSSYLTQGRICFHGFSDMVCFHRQSFKLLNIEHSCSQFLSFPTP